MCTALFPADTVVKDYESKDVRKRQESRHDGTYQHHKPEQYAPRPNNAAICLFGLPGDHLSLGAIAVGGRDPPTGRSP